MVFEILVYAVTYGRTDLDGARPLSPPVDLTVSIIRWLTPQQGLQALVSVKPSSPEISPIHGCGRGSACFGCVERGQGARRTVKYACAP